MNRSLLAGLTTVLVAATVAAPVQAASATGTVGIGGCTIKTSRNAGGFAWAYCPITSVAVKGQAVTVHYRVNLKTYVPLPNASYSAQSGKLGFPANSQTLLNVKFAFKGLSASQVKSRLKVTLSNAIGATITSATARAK
jgi:hypothetical protein